MASKNGMKILKLAMTCNIGTLGDAFSQISHARRTATVDGEIEYSRLLEALDAIGRYRFDPSQWVLEKRRNNLGR